MQDKQKVTLYLPPELHRQLKIRAALDSETMTDIAQRAIVFYLSHPEVVESHGSVHGQSHRVYSCPDCTSPVVVRDGEMVSLRKQTGVLVDDIEDGIAVGKAASVNSATADSVKAVELIGG